AEDGIRGLIVTGVQTCALPIWRRDFVPEDPERGPVFPETSRLARRPLSRNGAVDRLDRGAPFMTCLLAVLLAAASNVPDLPKDRSEERRVGKECRIRQRPGHCR